MKPVSWLYGLFDLNGADGRPSFAKLVVVSILCWALIAGAMNEYIATLVVAAAFGRPTLLAFLGRTSWSKSRSETRAHTYKHEHDPGA